MMAAGLGTRLRPFSEQVPKPLLPLFGIPWAQFTFDALSRAGVKKAVANIHHLAPQTSKGLMGLERNGIDLRLSDESSLILGSGGGIRTGMTQLSDGPFFIVNLDIISDVDLKKLAGFHQIQKQRWGTEITLVVIPGATVSDENYREIIFERDTHLITGLGEKKKQAPFYASIAVIEAAALSHLPVGAPFEFVSEILAPAIARRKASAYFTKALWYDVGTPRQWLATHTDLIERLETGDLPKLWRDRIEFQNKRVGQEVWTSKSSQPRNVSEWVGPAYWDGQNAKVPTVLGPRAVLYGSAPSQKFAQKCEDGIGMNGIWVSNSSSN